jgi:hypothetical protein
MKAKEKARAYENNIKEADQLPLVVDRFFLRFRFKITRRTRAPDNRRIDVKLAASMVSWPRARRHSTELAAKAINANRVKTDVLISAERLA